MSMTMKELAKLANVSPPVVSAIINNNYKNTRVSPDKRERLLKLIKELNFIPNATAQNLATKRTKILNVITPSAAFFDIPNNTKYIMGMQEAADEKGYRITFTSLSTAYKNYSYLDGIIADGVIIFYWGEGQDLVIDAFKKLGHPILVAYGKCTVSGVLNMYYDNRTAMYEMTKSVISNGKKNIVYAEVHSGDIYHQEGEAGILKAIEEHKEVQFTKINLDSQMNIEDHSKRLLTVGKDSIDQILKLPIRPNCVIYNNDLIAVGGSQEAQKRGVSIPQDMSVTGNGNTYLSEYLSPQITTIDIQPRLAGRQSGDMLIRLIEKQSMAEMSIPIKTQLILRESV